MTAMTVEQLAWLAGFIDGEGSIGFHEHKMSPFRPNQRTPVFVPFLQISNTHLGVLRHIAQWFPKSRIHIDARRARQGHLPCGLFVIAGLAVYPVLEMLLPFLVIKKPQAEAVLEFRALPKFKRWRTGINGPQIAREKSRIPPDELEKRLRIVTHIRALNHRGLASQRARLP